MIFAIIPKSRYRISIWILKLTKRLNRYLYNSEKLKCFYTGRCFRADGAMLQWFFKHDFIILMIYSFFNFKLNTDNKELTIDQEIVPLTKQNFELLHLFVKNVGKVFSKEDLIETLWQGRYVTENTIDQSVSKLRKLLNSAKAETYIKTAYGKGFYFVPKVEIVQPKKAKKKHNVFLYTMLVLALFAVALVWNKNTVETKIKTPSSLVMIMSQENKLKENDWLNEASVAFIDEVFSFANAAQLKDFKNKPEYLSRQQYIDNQWKISPDLIIVTTHVSHKNNVYTVELMMQDKQQNNYSQSFSNKNLSHSMRQASQWLAEKVKYEQATKKIDSLIPEDSYLLELYMRGLVSYGKGELDKAEHFFKLCLEEKSDFHLARLRLAKVLNSQGKQDKSLALLATLSSLDVFPQIEIEVETIRGDIYDTQGKYQQARDLYLSILNKYKEQSLPQLNEIRYNLSYTYSVLTEYEKALTQLNQLESSIKKDKNIELLANVLQKKASILQKIGQTQQAETIAKKSLDLFSQQEDLLGEAKTYTLLARINTHRSKYKESVAYLEQALLINKSLDYQLGTGATLNEIIYVLMVQGEFSKAWESNLEMQKIAIEIDYNAMLQISKQYAVDISRALKKWKRAELYLQEHLQLAQASNNTRALLKNKLLALDLYLQQKKTSAIKELLTEVQTYIDNSKEVRLQPRLNLKRARYYFLIGENNKAVELLQMSKDLAEKTDDGETIIEINNLLAEHYLQQKQAQKALAVLESSVEYNPLPYPYLLLKAKVYQLKGESLKALDFAYECKKTANEWWNSEDEQFLSELISPNKPE